MSRGFVRISGRRADQLLLLGGATVGKAAEDKGEQAASIHC